MQEIILELMNHFGYVGVLLLIAIENIFPPIPSEVILSFGGFMTTYANLTVVGMIIASTVGSILGAIALYGVGRLLTRERLMEFCDSKLGRMLHFKKEHINKAEDWFANKGMFTVFFCRFVPIVRSLISIPAGMTKMKFLPFVVLTTVGSAIWNTVLVVLGRVAGDSWGIVVDYISKYSKIVLIAILLVAIILLVVWYQRKWKAKLTKIQRQESEEE